MRRIGTCAAALLLAGGAGGLAGCGGGGDEALSTSAGDALHADIESVRAAAERDRDPAALAALKKFRATVRDLADKGELNPADARVLLTQADRIAAGLKVSAPSSPAVTVRSDPVPAAVTKKSTAVTKKSKGQKKSADQSKGGDEDGKGKNRGGRGEDD